MNPDITEQPAHIQVQRYSNNNTNNTEAEAAAEMNADIKEQLADIHIQPSANGHVEAVNGAEDTVDILERQTTQFESQLHAHDNIDNSTADPTVELNTDIMEQLAGIDIQPSANDHIDVANGMEATLGILEQQPIQLESEPDHHNGDDTTIAGVDVDLTPNMLGQQPTELRTELYFLDNTTADGRVPIAADNMGHHPTYLETQSYTHDIDTSTVGGGALITSAIMQQHPTAFQTQFHSRAYADSTMANASLDMIDMNTDIVERQVKVQDHPPPEVDVGNEITHQTSYHGIREYVNFSTASSDQPWLALPELPTAEEVGSFVGDRPATLEYALQHNKIDGPWRDKEYYLRSHYELLREDAVAPLRDVVQEFHQKPNMMERDSKEHAAIYEKVICTFYWLVRADTP